MNALLTSELDELMDDTADCGAAVVAPDGHWLRVNQLLCEMLGYPEQDLLQKTFQEITVPEDLVSERPYLNRMTEGKLDYYQFQKRYVHQDGHIVWGVLNRSVVRDDEGQVRCFISHIREITPAQAHARNRQPWFEAIRGRLGRLLRGSR